MDGDRLLDAVGIVLVLAVVASLLFVGMMVVDPPENTHDEPTTDWTLQRENDTHVRIVHAGGESVHADDLMVTVDGDRQTVTASGRVNEGDALVVAAEPGSNIELYWTGGRGGPVLLSTWR